VPALAARRAAAAGVQMRLSCSMWRDAQGPAPGPRRGCRSACGARAHPPVPLLGTGAARPAGAARRHPHRPRLPPARLPLQGQEQRVGQAVDQRVPLLPRHVPHAQQEHIARELVHRRQAPLLLRAGQANGEGEAPALLLQRCVPHWRRLAAGCAGASAGASAAPDAGPLRPPPQLSQPLPKGALDGVTVLMGPAGQSCDQACKAQKLRCSSKHLALLNTCDRLREQVRAAPRARLAPQQDAPRSCAAARCSPQHPPPLLHAAQLLNAQRPALLEPGATALLDSRWTPASRPTLARPLRAGGLRGWVLGGAAAGLLPRVRGRRRAQAAAPRHVPGRL
jgi:hypothetical protein